MRINKEKPIGRVLFIVEGSRNEFNLLRKIFCNILQYEYVEKRRNSPEAFVSKNDSHSKVAVINTKESNIGDITDNEEYLDSLFEMLQEKYHFPVDQSAIYYLFDRDPESNTDVEKIKSYINDLKNPYENENSFKAGQLLLSYPSIESYMISNFCKDSFCIRKMLGKDAKAFIGDNTEIQLNKISEDTLIHATYEFINFLENEEIEWDIDEFESASLHIFQEQEVDYRSEKGFRLFSMLTLAFLQMGIIEM